MLNVGCRLRDADRCSLSRGKAIIEIILKATDGIEASLIIHFLQGLTDWCLETNCDN